ncbi:MAG: hypothetical protein L6R42_007712 [Xanthoria sp. 1 TBL-2021]|nr:MAG: hypothetical protein L6R42_007712 [Xanthoria sp. 1 TBL-2021]
MSTTTTTKPPKPPTHIPPTTTLHPLTTFTGTHPLTLGAQTYIHLRAILSTTHAPLEIGAHCIIGEKAILGLQQNEKEEEKKDGTVLLEDHVIIEPQAVIQAAKIGTGTVVGVGAKIGKGASVGKYCKIGPLCSVAPYDDIPDYTVIYGYNERRRDRSGMEEVRMKAVEQQVEVLRRAEFAARKK